MKTLLSVVLIFCSTAYSTSVFAETAFRCVWEKASNAPEGFFKVNSSFDILDFQNGELMILNDTFFNRTYTPCYVGGYESCMFAYSYDFLNTWKKEGLGGDDFEATQNWVFSEEHGTVGGVSALTFRFENKTLLDTVESKTVVSGDDGDGTFFKGEFLCKKVDTEKALLNHILNQLLSNDD